MRPPSIAITVIGLLCIVADARASCSGSLTPLCARWQEDYDAVFDGTVVSIRRVDLPDRHNGGRLIGHRLITFDVHDEWKGNLGHTVDLLQYGGYGVVTSNDFHAEKGVRYVIFAHYDDGTLATSSCSPSRRYADATETLEMLNWSRAPATGGRISVTAQRMHSPLLPDISPPPFVAAVELSGPVRRSMVVGSNGAEFRDLPAGTYTVAASTRDPDVKTRSPATIEIPHLRACGAAWFVFEPNSSISGHIMTSDGSPVQTEVDLVVAHTRTQKAPTGTSTWTDETGSFAFAGVPPGRYVLALNLEDTISYQPRPRTFLELNGEPEVLDVSAGQDLSIGSWRVAPPLAQVRLKVHVIGPDGRPYAGSGVSLIDGRPAHRDWREHIMSGVTDSAGYVEFEAFATRRYVVRSSPDHERGPAYESEAFAAEQATKALILVLRPVSRE